MNGMGGASIATSEIPSSSGAPGANSRRARSTSGACSSRPEDRPAQHQRPDRVQVVLEGGGDPEVAAAAAQAPEEIRVVIGVDALQLAVGGHELGGAQVVDHEPVAAQQVSEPAAERQPRDPHVTDRRACGGQPVPLGCEVELALAQTGGGPRDGRHRVNGHGLHQRQVDHDRAVAHRMADGRAPTAADGDLQITLAREAQRLLHVIGPRAPRDQRRPAVDRAVPDPPRLLVALLARSQQRAAEAPPKLAQRPCVDGPVVDPSSCNFGHRSTLRKAWRADHPRILGSSSIRADATIGIWRSYHQSACAAT